MSTFAEVMQADPPRLVVKYQAGEGTCAERFAWGLTDRMQPLLLALVGYVTRVQVELATEREVHLRVDPCDELALVVTWDEHRRAFRYFLHPDVPVNPLLGMLEVVRQGLLAAEMGRSARAQAATGLVLPNGRPVPR